MSDSIISSYGSLYNDYTAEITHLLKKHVIVEEKIDGSQFSFQNIGGDMFFRSKAKAIPSDVDQKHMFRTGIDSIISIQDKIPEGFIFRTEYLCKPKHNTLSYSRIPKHNVIVFDIFDTIANRYLNYREMTKICLHIGLEHVPLLFDAIFTRKDQFNHLLALESILGGCKVEGVVVKLADQDNRAPRIKIVSPEFKERFQHKRQTKKPLKSTVVETIVAELRTEARFRKAAQHLRDRGELAGNPTDIPKLLEEISKDLRKEEETYIKDQLFKANWGKISKGVLKGAGDFYIEEVLRNEG